MAIIVPARDEAEVLPLSLPTLLAQPYAGSGRVILVDDSSTDGTGELARELGRAPGSLPLTVTTPGEPPEGWTGSCGPCGTAWSWPGTDAPSTCCSPTPTSPTARTGWTAGGRGGGLLAESYDLVSQMARLRVETRWERLIVPAFVYFFAQLYPFRRINHPRSRTAAAAGGCVLVRARRWSGPG